MGFNNQHFSIVSIGVGGGGERVRITIVLSQSHCTIDSYLLIIRSPPHPPFVSLLSVRRSSPMLRLSCCLSVSAAA